MDKDLYKENEELKAKIKAFEKYLPKRIVEKIHTNPYNVRVEGERRFVTILFGDVSGFTALSERLDPEEVIKVINKYFNKMLYIVEKYGGDVDKFVGDAIMVVFGAPVAHKNDPERAVRAALEMQEAIETIEPVLAKGEYIKVRMSIGINTGEIVALNLGTDERMEYTVMGDNVNLSARLEAVANATEVIISDRTYKYVKDIFDFEVLEPVMVKGKKDPIPIFKALNVKKKIASDKEFPIIAYKNDLKNIDNMIVNAMNKKSFSLSIIGKEGTGKTKILLYAYDKIDKKNLSLIPFKGESFFKHSPFYPIKTSISDLLKIKSNDSNEIIKGKIDNVLNEDLDVNDIIIPINDGNVHTSYQGPVFNGPGLEGGANLVNKHLDDKVSKEKDIKELIIGWTNFLLGVAALLAVVALVWAGFMYITSLGDDSNMEKAKKIIIWVVIGLLLILAAYAIVNTVMKAAF